MVTRRTTESLQETRIIDTSNMCFLQLHIIWAHHLHYTSLLDDFGKHIAFICDTHNPALEHLTDEVRQFNRNILERECANLLTEIDRLKSQLCMQERRLKNAMALVSIQYSTLMRPSLTFISCRLSALWVLPIARWHNERQRLPFETVVSCEENTYLNIRYLGFPFSCMSSWYENFDNAYTRFEIDQPTRLSEHDLSPGIFCCCKRPCSICVLSQITFEM